MDKYLLVLALLTYLAYNTELKSEGNNSSHMILSYELLSNPGDPNEGDTDIESEWIPGVTKAGEPMYAAKSAGGKNIAVDPASPEATQFSLMGAVLREFALRNVARNAQGRRRLLDQEIPNAIKEAIGGEEPGEEREFSTGEILGISRDQCLEALDILEQRYRTRKIEASREDATEKFGKIRLDQLLKRMEKKLRVSPDEIVVAVFLEFQEVLERLERLERNQSTRRSSSGAG
jgi:hypothetical protein